MILDERTEFADAVAVAGVAATYNVGDVVDLGSVVRDIGNGQMAYMVIQVETAPAGADTCSFQIVSDAITTPDLATRSSGQRLPDARSDRLGVHT